MTAQHTALIRISVNDAYAELRITAEHLAVIQGTCYQIGEAIAAMAHALTTAQVSAAQATLEVEVTP